MRARVVAGAVVIAAAAGVLVWAVGTAEPEAPTPEETISAEKPPSARDTVRPVTTASAEPVAPAALTAPGSVIFAGVPAVVSLTDAGGRAVTVRITVQGLQEVPAGAATELLEQTRLGDSGWVVYELPVTVTILSAEASLDAAALNSITVATHPGEGALQASNTLTSSCTRLPRETRAFAAGDSLSWCVHAFRGPQDPAPIGGQFQTAAGPYSSGVLWVVPGFAPDVEIPES